MTRAAGLVFNARGGRAAELGPPLHVHQDTAEAFYVLEGEYHHVVEGGSTAARPARSCSSRTARHGFRVGAVASRKLNLYAPAEMIGYFDDLSEAMARGEADPAKLDEIAQRHGMEVVGPVPEGYL